MPRTVACVFSNICLVNGRPDFLGNVFELINPNPVTLERTMSPVNFALKLAELHMYEAEKCFHPNT